MLGSVWNTLLYQPIINGLIFLYQVLGQNLGLAIIALTGLIRVILIPFTNSSLRAARKMQDLAPEIAKLKALHKDDKTAFAAAQMELYKKHGANPAAGCLPQIIQLIVLIALYQAFNQTLTTNGQTISHLNNLLYQPLKLAADTHLNTNFLYLNLAKPDIFHFTLPNSNVNLPIPGLFLILAIVVQFLSSKMMMPAVKAEEKLAKKEKNETEDIMASTQEQMLYLFPLMTLLIGFNFPSGLVLYWFLFSFLSAVQQYFVSGWGGLTPWIKTAKEKLGRA